MTAALPGLGQGPELDCPTVPAPVEEIEEVCRTVDSVVEPPAPVEVGTAQVTIPPPAVESSPPPPAPTVPVPVPVPVPVDRPVPAVGEGCTAVDPGRPTCEFTASGSIEVEVFAVVAYVSGGARFEGAGYNPPQHFSLVLPAEPGAPVTVRAVGGWARVSAAKAA